MQRVNVYIDGFNFYHGLRKARKEAPEFQQFYWLDMVKFFDHFILPGQTLQKVYYFTAPDHDSIRRVRQDALLRANTLVNGNRFKVVNGVYYKKTIRCRLCKGEYDTHEEKCTDVNISAYMMRDCALNNVDAVILVTADSDLSTPIILTRTDYPKKQLRLFYPPMLSSKALTKLMKQARKNPIHLINHKQKFANSLLPDVVSVNGVTLTIPKKWKDTYIAPATSNTVTDTVMDIYANHFGTGQIIERTHPNIAAFIKDLNQFAPCPNCTHNP